MARLPQQQKINNNCNCVGQECPTHTLAAHQGGAHFHGLEQQPHGRDKQNQAHCSPGNEGAHGLPGRIVFGQTIEYGQRAGKAQQQEPDFDHQYDVCRQAGESPARLSKNRPSQSRQCALGYRNDGVETGQKMKPVVGQPHAEAHGHKAVSVAHHQREQGAPAARPDAGQPCCHSQEHDRLQNQKKREDDAEHRRFMAHVQYFSQPALHRINRTDHAKGVQQCAEGKHNGQRSQVFAA